jgi:HSP20 family protein
MFREMDQTRRHFDGLLGTPLLPAIWRRAATEERVWSPAIEVLEKDDKFIVRAELPGLAEEDVEVHVGEGAVTIKGEKKAETETEEEGHRWSERRYGSFTRRVRFPSSVDAENIEASYGDGVLEITLPKVAEIKPKRLTLKPRVAGETTAEAEEPGGVEETKAPEDTNTD